MGYNIVSSSGAATAGEHVVATVVRKLLNNDSSAVETLKALPLPNGGLSYFRELHLQNKGELKDLLQYIKSNHAFSDKDQVHIVVKIPGGCAQGDLAELTSLPNVHFFIVDSGEEQVKSGAITRFFNAQVEHAVFGALPLAARRSSAAAAGAGESKLDFKPLHEEEAEASDDGEDPKSKKLKRPDGRSTKPLLNLDSKSDKNDNAKTLERIREGLKSTWQHHKIRILAPMIVLGLFLFLPISTATGSVLPDVTIWLLANIGTALWIGGVVFLAGYLMFQASKTLPGYDSSEHAENSKSQQAERIFRVAGQFLMWSAVGFGLFTALFTPAISTFLQEAVIGNGVTGFVSQFLTSNMGVVAGIVFASYLLGVFLTKTVGNIWKDLSKFKAESFWYKALVHTAALVGIVLVYGSAFLTVFIPLAMSLGSTYLGLAVATFVTVGPILGKVIGKFGQLTGWVADIAQMCANAVAISGMYVLYLAAIIEAKFYFWQNPVARDVVASDSKSDDQPLLAADRKSDSADSAANPPAIPLFFRSKSGPAPKPEADAAHAQKVAKALDTRAIATLDHMIRHGIQNKVGRWAFAGYKLVASIIVAAFQSISLSLGEVNKGFEVLEGRPGPARTLSRAPAHADGFGQTTQGYNPLLPAGDARAPAEHSLFVSDTQQAAAFLSIAALNYVDAPFENTITRGQGADAQTSRPCQAIGAF